MNIVLTWTHKVSKNKGPKPVKITLKAIILHTSGVQVLLFYHFQECVHVHMLDVHYHHYPWEMGTVKTQKPHAIACDADFLSLYNLRRPKSRSLPREAVGLYSQP